MKSSRHLGVGMTSQRTRERLILRLESEGITNALVLAVMRTTPRHIFVDEALASRAYDGTALPIGHGQTISQPYIVARMTEVLLNGGPLKKVLEIGTGSGYQAAVLAQLAEQVYSVERIEPFLKIARSRFQELGLRNVRLKISDGSVGWPEYGPYDGIILTAAPIDIPPALLQQLALNGRLVAPVGGSGNQTLKLIRRTPEAYVVEDLEAVSFVPFYFGS